MKRIKILLLLLFLATGFSVNAMNPKSGPSHNSGSQFSDDGRKGDGRKGEGRKGEDNKGKGKGPHTGAPLDGGLLTVLGVAGVGYFVARKKGKKPES